MISSGKRGLSLWTLASKFEGKNPSLSAPFRRRAALSVHS
jgi:hypothetical protein